MEKIKKNYLKERKYFISNYENLSKEIRVIINAPSDEIPETTLENAISLLHKCEESLKKMDELVKSMKPEEKLVLEETIFEVQSKKDVFKKRKEILLLLEEIVKS